MEGHATVNKLFELADNSFRPHPSITLAVQLSKKLSLVCREHTLDIESYLRNRDNQEKTEVMSSVFNVALSFATGKHFDDSTRPVFVYLVNSVMMMFPTLSMLPKSRQIQDTATIMELAEVAEEKSD